jgi:drug/metabolite transporter (DMT)-like permease
MTSQQDNAWPSMWLRAMPGIFVLIWATGFVSAKLAMPHADPFSFLCARYAASIICLGAWIAWARPAWPQGRAQWLHLGITGVLMHAGYLGGVWAAIKLGMSAGLSALIVSLQPILTAMWLSSRGSIVSRQQWLGLLLGLVGLACVLSEKFGTKEVALIPMLWIVLALASITIGTLYQKAWVTPCDFRTANSVQLMGALLVSAPLAWLEPHGITWNHDTVIALAWAVLGLTMGASSLMYIMIQRGAVTRVTSLLYLVPPSTAVIAWLMFGERITGLMMLGVLIAAYAVWLVLKPAPEAKLVSK